LTVGGNTILGDALADTITFNGTVGGSTFMVLEGSTSDGNDLSLALADPTISRTITFPNATGTVAVSAGIATGVALDALGDVTINIDGAADGTAVVIADTDLFLMSDGGTEKRVQASQLKTYISSTETKKGLTVVTVNKDANSNINVDNTNISDAEWGSTGGPRAADREVYLNGQLLIGGGGAGTDNDWYPGTGTGQVKFEFPLVAGDVIQWVIRV